MLPCDADCLVRLITAAQQTAGICRARRHRRLTQAAAGSTCRAGSEACARTLKTGSWCAAAGQRTWASSGASARGKTRRRGASHAPDVSQGIIDIVIGTRKPQDETATNRRKNHSRSGRTQQGANDTSGPPLARSSRQICVRKTGRPRLRSIRSTVRTLSFLRVRTHVFPLGHCNFLIFSGWSSIGGTEPIPRSSGSSRLAGAGLLTPAACWVRATLCAQASRQSRMGRGSTQPGEHECSWRYIRGSPLNYEAPVERAHLRCMWAGAQAPAAAITWTRRAEG